jgi:hypothetical protein
MHSQQCSSLVFGSQRRFFNRVFARLNEIPLGDRLVPQKDENDFKDLLRDFSFSHRMSKGSGAMKTKEFWQCMKCRMVPLDMRAAGSIFFQQPTGEELMSHFNICQKDGTSWDLIDFTMKELEDKYRGEIKVVDRDSFADLIRAVVGSTDAVYVSVMTKLGKTFPSSKTIEISNTVWRKMPASVDMNEVQIAFQSLKNDLRLNESQGHVFAGSDLLDFLTMLNCNFCPPPLQQEGETFKRKDVCITPLNPSKEEEKGTADRSARASLSSLYAPGTMETDHCTSAQSPEMMEDTTSGTADMPQSSPKVDRILEQLGKSDMKFSGEVNGGQFDDPDD